MNSRLQSLVVTLVLLPMWAHAYTPPYGDVLGRLSVEPLVFPDAEPLSGQTIRVPFKLAGHLILVRARVGGRTGNFILDTGSSKLILNARYFRGGKVQENVTGIGMTGGLKEVRTTAVRDFAWDSLSYHRLDADLIDLNHIETKKNIDLLGLIGYSAIQDYETLIDFQLKQVTLTALDAQGNRLDTLAFYEQPVDSLEVQLQQHFLVIAGEVEGNTLRFGLDSGAELNLLDKGVGRRVLDHFKISRRTRLNGIEGSKQIEVIAGKLYRFRSGRQRCSGMRTLLTNMRRFNRTYMTRLDGLIGYEFLCVRRTLINYKKQKLYFFEWYRP